MCLVNDNCKKISMVMNEFLKLGAETDAPPVELDDDEEEGDSKKRKRSKTARWSDVRGTVRS